MKNILVKTLSLSVTLVMICRLSSGAKCFTDELPTFLQEEDFQDQQYNNWRSMIINKAQDTLFVGGETTTHKMFMSDPPSGTQLGMAASYSLVTNTYKWVKVYRDQNGSVQSITGLALNYAETVLVLAGEIQKESSSPFVFLFFLDPATGGKKYNTYKIETQSRLYLQSARSILLAGATRVYVTGRSWNDKKQYTGQNCTTCGVSATEDSFQYFIFDYDTGTIVTNRYSIKNSGFGQGTGASLLDVNRATATINGAESVKILGAHSQYNTVNQWVIGIYDISASTGELSGLGIKYLLGSYYNQREKYQFADAFDQSTDRLKLFFTTTSRQQEIGFYGDSSHLCIVTYTSAAFAGSATANCKKFASSTTYNEYFHLAMAFRDNYFNIIYQNRDGLIGYYKTDFTTHVNVQSLAQKHKPWAAVFADGKSHFQIKNQIGTGNYTQYRGYFAGQAQAFSSSNYPSTGNSHTFGDIDGLKTAAAIDAILDKDTCRSYSHTFITQWASSPVTTVIETYASLTTITVSTSPSTTLYKAYDLDFDETITDNLCSTFPTKNPNTSPNISDLTLYCGDLTRYECPAPQFTLQDTTCDDTVKFLYSIEEEISTKSHYFTVDPSTSKIYIQVLDSSVCSGTHEIEYQGVTPAGQKVQDKFNVTMASGPPPSGYSGCPSFTTTTATTTCFTSLDTITMTAETKGQQTYKVGDAIGYLQFDEMTEDGASCQTSDIKYSSTVIAVGPSSDTSFIGFDDTSRTFNWQASVSQVGTYTVKIIGTITRSSGNIVKESSFNLVVVTELTCTESTDELELAASEISDQVHVVGSGINERLQIEPFTVKKGTYCKDTDITYTFDNTGMAFISFEASTMTFDWSGHTSVDRIIEYILSLEGKIKRSSGYEKTITNVFKLTIKMDCEHSTDTLAIIKETEVPSQIYQLYSSAQSVSTPFSVSAEWCQASDMLVTMSVSAAGRQSTEFITFDSKSMLVQWETLDPTKVGFYLITVNAKVTRKAETIQKNHQFSLQVVPVPKEVNQAPVLVKLHALIDKSNQVTYKVEELSGLTFLDFGPIIDYDGDSIIVETLYIKSLFTFNKGLLAFDYQALMAARLSTQQLTYEVKLTLTDSRAAVTQYTVYFIVPIDQNKVDPAQQAEQIINTTNTSATTAAKVVSKSAEYSFKGVVIGDEALVDKDAAPPYWKSITTSDTGQVKIYFSEKMIRPSNYTFIDDQILQVDLIPSGAVDLKFLKFTWHVAEFTTDYFTIQLIFSDPLFVSCTGKNNYDKILVKNLYPKLFYSSTSFKSIETEHSLNKALPPQLSSNKAANEVLASVTGTAATSSKTVAIGAFILNILMSASLQLLWGMINALQIIGHLPYFNVYMPASAQAFFTAVNELADLKIIPTDQIITWLFQNETDHIFKQMGTLFLVLIVGVLLLLLLIVCNSQSERFDCAFDITQRIKYQIFWNGTLRYFMEGYMAFSLNSLLNQVQGLDWSTHFTRLTSLFSVVILALVFLLPVFMTIFFRLKFSMFNDPEFFDKFQEIIGDLSYRSKYSSYFILIYCYRRLAQICLIIFSAEYAWLQIQMQVVIGMLAVIIYGYISAHKIPRDRRMEYFNEVTIMMCVYHLFVFTDFVDDPITRYYAGFSLIGVTCLNIVGNVAVLLTVTLKLVYFNLKKKVYNLRNNRIIKKNLKAKNFNKQAPNHLQGNQPQQKDVKMSSSIDNDSEQLSQLRSEYNDMELAIISELASQLENDSSQSSDSLYPKHRAQIFQLSNRLPVQQGNFSKQSEILRLEDYILPPYDVEPPIKQDNLSKQSEILRLQDYELPPRDVYDHKPMSTKEFNVRMGALLDDGQRLIDAIEKKHEEERMQFYL